MNAPPATIAAPSPAWVRVLPFALFIGVLVLRSALQQSDALARLDSRWWYAVQALLPAIALAVFWRHYPELHRSAPSRARITPGQTLLAVGTGLAIFVLWINATLPWMRLGEPAARFVPLDGTGAIEWSLVAVRLAGAVVVVPLMEELFWRSFLMRWLDERDFVRRDPGAATPFAIAGSSVAFALAHDLLLAGLIAGVAFALLYRASGNLWIPILAHAVANLALGAWVVSERAWAFW